MLTVVAWSWGGKFEPVYVSRLQAALRRHLHLEHELVLVKDEVSEAPPGVLVHPMSTPPAGSPFAVRCRRRMKMFSQAFADGLRACHGIEATRILAIDLDVVIVDDITPIVRRTEPIVGWKVRHTGTTHERRVISGSFLLFDAGALHGAWEQFRDNPEAWPAQLGGNASDQAMVNDWLRTSQTSYAYWTEADGFVTYFGKGYERLEHLGVGPNQQELPPGARIVVLGSADKDAMDTGAYEWIRRNWVD